MEQGFDPDIKKHFIKIINSFSMGFFWLLVNLTAGIYFGLGYRSDIPVIYVVLFYIFFVISLLALLKYYYRTWKK